MKTKICTKCKIEKLLSEFSKYKSGKDGLRYWCKKCDKEYCQKNKEKILKQNKEYCQKNKDKIKLYQQQNKEKILKQNKEYRQKNKDKISKRQKDYRLKNSEKVKKSWKKYREKHKEERNKYQTVYRLEHREYYKKHNKNYCKKRRKTDINFKMAGNLRTRLNNAIIRESKFTSIIDLIDCSIEKLKQHLESQFKSEMSWDNYGRGYGQKGMKEWHIDHIKPCAKFDLTKPEEQRKCFHYTNLQPLWAKENRKKGAMLPPQ